MHRPIAALATALVLVLGGATSAAAAPTTSITTSATSGVLGGSVHDTATLVGATQDAVGSIIFELWGPSSTPDCSGGPLFTSTAQVNGPGEYGSGNFTPSTAGSYYWVALYTGDSNPNNTPVSGNCGDPGETSVIKAAPTLSTVASPDASIEESVTDAATLAGGDVPTGTIEFALYGPGDPTCSGVPAFVGSKAVTGNGVYVSPAFSPTVAGTYTWFAEYTGDAGNAAAGSCGGVGETVTVARERPTLATQASADVGLGGQIRDKATLSGGRAPSGSIVFRAYGPNDATCSDAPSFSAAVPVARPGEYSSPDFTPPAAGVYRWTAAYSGDANNEPVAGACNDANESVIVSPAPAESVTTTKPATVTPAVCTPIEPVVGNYVPRPPATPPSAAPLPGVRARLWVPQPSDQQVVATLRFRWNGRAWTVNLGGRTLSNPGTANLRVALPAIWRDRLAVGTKVVLDLRITSTPHGAEGCVSPTRSARALRTRVGRVLGG